MPIIISSVFILYMHMYNNGNGNRNMPQLAIKYNKRGVRVWGVGKVGLCVAVRQKKKKDNGGVY